MARLDDDFEDFFSADDIADTPSDADSTPQKVPPRLGLLANLSSEEFTIVARAATLKHHEPGTVIFRQGDPADRFFILVDGAVEIRRDDEVIASLEPGSFFGESALLVSGNRSATVITTAPSSIWSVDYTAFDGVVSRQLLADEAARKVVDQRLEETRPEHFS